MTSLFKSVFITLLLSFIPIKLLAEAPDYLMTKAKQEKTTPARALEMLQEGNDRFIKGRMRKYNFAEIAKYSASGQFPFAVVLNCMDSRSAPDYTFDQGLGNIFITRMAGNVIDTDVLGSMEFATKFAGVKLIAVVGHTYCGAIVGACRQVEAGNLTHLLASIQPAVKEVKAKLGDKFSCDDNKVIDAITKQNVINQMKIILSRSSILRDLIKSKKVMLVGGMHDLTSGKVEFFTPDGHKF